MQAFFLNSLKISISGPPGHFLTLKGGNIDVFLHPARGKARLLAAFLTHLSLFI
jgi:hypothetical protein